MRDKESDGGVRENEDDRLIIEKRGTRKAAILNAVNCIYPRHPWMVSLKYILYIENYLGILYILYLYIGC